MRCRRSPIRVTRAAWAMAWPQSWRWPCARHWPARSYAAIAEWASGAPAGLRAQLSVPGAVPDLVTICRVLSAVDPAALDWALGSWGHCLARSRPDSRHAAGAGSRTPLRPSRSPAGPAGTAPGNGAPTATRSPFAMAVRHAAGFGGRSVLVTRGRRGGSRRCPAACVADNQPGRIGMHVHVRRGGRGLARAGPGPQAVLTCSNSRSGHVGRRYGRSAGDPG